MPIENDTPPEAPPEVADPTIDDIFPTDNTPAGDTNVEPVANDGDVKDKKDTTVVDDNAKTPEETKDDDAEVKAGKSEKFQEESAKVFDSEDGTFDSDKLLNFIDDKGGFLESVKYEPSEPSPEIDASKNPEEFYKSSLVDIAKDIDSIIQRDLDNGYTEKEILEGFKATFANMNATKETQLEKLRDKDDIKNEMRKEFKTEHAKAVQTQIDTVTNELSEKYTDFIPGMSGRDVFESMVLVEGLGGGVAKVLFNRDNPGFANLPKEEQANVEKEWHDKFLSSKADMALAAEVGEHRWFRKQLPQMLKRAMAMGERKAATARYAGGGGVLPGVAATDTMDSADKVLNEFING